MIEHATQKDLNEIMIIYDSIKEEMRQEKNPQWGSTEDDYPSENKIKGDISKKILYKYVEDNEIKGVITIMEDQKREYDELLENNKEKAIILHRLAIPKRYRKQNIAMKLIKYGEDYAKNNNVKVIKSDTEISNQKMNNLFKKAGFSFKGTFSYDDYPGVYNYYEKEIERS